MKVLAITQARYGSTRLPAKILKEVNGMTLLELHLRRILQSKMISKLKVATTDEEGSRFIIDVCNKVGVEYHQGSVDDVLDRFYQTALPEKPDYVVRVTSDCPLIDPEIMDQIIKVCIEGNYDYASNTLIPTYPDGMDVEVFTFSALETAWKDARLLSEHEHVTPYIKNNSSVMGGSIFNSFNVVNDTDQSSLRITVDEQRDFEVIKALIENVGIDKHCADYVAFLDAHKDVKDINASIMRNEGYAKSLANDKEIKSN
jgi:spore coat polysaccharide biosynthesis protein SpsF (cytidylyltransferase family)